MRPRCPAFFNDTTATPCLEHFSVPSRVACSPTGLPETELPVDDGHHIVFELDTSGNVRQDLARLQPPYVGSHTQHAMRIVPYQVRGNQT